MEFKKNFKFKNYDEFGLFVLNNKQETKVYAGIYNSKKDKVLLPTIKQTEKKENLIDIFNHGNGDKTFDVINIAFTYNYITDTFKLIRKGFVKYKQKSICQFEEKEISSLGSLLKLEKSINHGIQKAEKQIENESKRIAELEF